MRTNIFSACGRAEEQVILLPLLLRFMIDKYSSASSYYYYCYCCYYFYCYCFCYCFCYCYCCYDDYFYDYYFYDDDYDGDDIDHSNDCDCACDLKVGMGTQAGIPYADDVQGMDQGRARCGEGLLLQQFSLKTGFNPDQ